MISRRQLVSGASLALASAVAPSPSPAAAAVTNRRDFPNLPLVTHEGRTVRFYDDLVKGRIVLFNFFYTRCDGLCLPVTSNLRKVQDLLGERVGRDIFMYSISLKPHEDSVADLRSYREEYEVKPGWTFLTGAARNCDQIRRRLGFADSDPVIDRDPTQHSGLLVFGNEPLDSWAACPAVTEAAEIVKAISWIDRPI